MADNEGGERKDMLEWPYPVNYGKENEVSTDILIIGGGIAGCHGAISARKNGATVALVDKAPIVRSGSGGAGVDHWHGALTNPCSRISPEDMEGRPVPPYSMGHMRYIIGKESWDALLDVEQWGLKIRSKTVNCRLITGSSHPMHRL